MGEKEIETYFKQQVHDVITRSITEPSGFLAYFEDREPRDEEILGLLAVNSVISGDLSLRDAFPTPLEALAALSNSSRTELCRHFREELNATRQQLAAA